MSAIKEVKMVKKEITVARQCDVCYTQITDLSQYEQEWFHFSESHHGWGNDSVESCDEYDVCSVSCFIKQLQDSLPNLLGYADSAAEIAGMPVKFAQELIEMLKEGKNG